MILTMNFGMMDRRKRRPKVVPRAAADFVRQLKIYIGTYCVNFDECIDVISDGHVQVVLEYCCFQKNPNFSDCHFLLWL